MSLTTSRLSSYALGVACMFCCGVSTAFAAIPGWYPQKPATENYRWRPLAVWSRGSAPAVPGYASRGFRPMHRKFPSQRIAPQFHRFVPPRVAYTGWRPIRAQRPYPVYGARDSLRPWYSPAPPLRTPAPPAFTRLAYDVRPGLAHYAVSPRIQGGRQINRPVTIAGYRFRPLSKRERHRRLRRGDMAIGAPAPGLLQPNPRAGLPFSLVPARYTRASLPQKKPQTGVPARLEYLRAGHPSTRADKFAANRQVPVHSYRIRNVRPVLAYRPWSSGNLSPRRPDLARPVSAARKYPFAFRSPAQFPHRARRVARPLPDFKPPAFIAFQPWFPPLHEVRVGRFASPRTPGAWISRRSSMAAPPWPALTGFRSPRGNPANEPVRRQLPWHGRAMPGGRQLALVHLLGAES